jgi:hypothetical protein
LSEIDALVLRYTHVVQLPWIHTLSPAEKVWFVVYPPSQERRLQLRLPDFQIATSQSGHAWQQIDLSDWFARWMANHKYREAYFRSPELIETALAAFARYTIEQVRSQLLSPDADANTVVALTGLGSLYGVASVSQIVNEVRTSVTGRLLVFFPGHKEGSNYRFLDAKDGWNYLSIAITTSDGESR